MPSSFTPTAPSGGHALASQACSTARWQQLLPLSCRSACALSPAASWSCRPGREHLLGLRQGSGWCQRSPAPWRLPPHLQTAGADFKGADDQRWMGGAVHEASCMQGAACSGCHCMHGTAWDGRCKRKEGTLCMEAGPTGQQAWIRASPAAVARCALPASALSGMRVGPPLPHSAQ